MSSTVRVASRGSRDKNASKSFFKALQISLVAATIAASILTIPIVANPVIYASAIRDDGAVAFNDSTPVRLLRYVGVRFTAFVFSLIEDRLLVLPCAAGAGEAHHFAPCPEETLSRPVMLKEFDTIAHTLFEFCIGLSVIFWLTRQGKWHLRRVRAFLSSEEQVRDARETFISGLSGRALQDALWRWEFETLMLKTAAWCLRIAVYMAYTCFFLTAFVSGLILTLVPFHAELAVNPTAWPEFVGYAFAPFAETVLLAAVVVMIVLFRAASPRGFQALSWARMSEQSLQTVTGALDSFMPDI